MRWIESFRIWDQQLMEVPFKSVFRLLSELSCLKYAHSYQYFICSIIRRENFFVNRQDELLYADLYFLPYLMLSAHLGGVHSENLCRVAIYRRVLTSQGTNSTFFYESISPFLSQYLTRRVSSICRNSYSSARIASLRIYTTFLKVFNL